ncbi:P-loop containing nucleoside triphosphate hydrolase protein [Podospora aff. communis PSN243]|uniref:P-loop containing nucleoside triphosphate hydrolase protein n=1 Tax=Podospora aff. communis PSN243 TaxID=3040156 RepID=A0AAV9GZG3_9PEZI|nr:P-loop containing nucleoside triphosphate hydrolase protein [Podospora aff. communis PSN243]
MDPFMRAAGITYKFKSAEEFAARHEAATRAEFEAELAEANNFNAKNIVLKAWVIKKVGLLSFIMRSDFQSMGGLVPQSGSPFRLVFVDHEGADDEEDDDDDYDVFDLPGNGVNRGERGRAVKFSCRMSAEPLELNKSWHGTKEFTLTATTRKLEKLGRLMVPLHHGNTDPFAVKRKNSEAVRVRPMLSVSDMTMNTQLDALKCIMDGMASEAGQEAFRYLLEFEKPRTFVDLFEKFPQMGNPNLVTSPTLREGLRKVFNGLDKDQAEAFYGLKALPAGICFVPGGPGAGKTRWSLSVATLAQAGVSQVKVLYLVDINSAADDAADRVQAMYDELKEDKVVIRMRTWPCRPRKKKDADDEATAEQTIELEEGEIFEEEEEEVEDMSPQDCLSGSDFTTGFLKEYDLLKTESRTAAPGSTKAQTLDQRAFQLWMADKGRYGFAKQVKTVCNDNRPLEERQAALNQLRRRLVPLYDDVIAEADFIVTTPVAASRHLAGFFEPDLVIFDECAHAHELSTLIALAHFEPRAWFFTGDHRQTKPFVKSMNLGHVRQLAISTMERAAFNGAIPYELLINHRARAGLECLASELFYGATMRSERKGDSALPLSTRHLRAWLQKLINESPKPQPPATLLGLDVPRLLISDRKNRPAEQVGTSHWNPAHHEFILRQITFLLGDANFVQPPPTRELPGTILIISPYKEAINHYRVAVNKLPQGRDRVSVQTVDTAQGQEADVVFLDLAEVILMSSRMANTWGALNMLWNRCHEGEDGAAIHLPM